MRLMPEKARLQSSIARRRDGRVPRACARACEKYLNAFHNLNYEMAHNGELEVIERLGLSSDDVFDVGANQGAWTTLVKRTYPAARVHAFEIDPGMVPLLTNNVGHLDGVTVVSQGLADTEGVMSINSYPDASVVTSLFDYPHPNERVTKDVDVTTGDLYAEREGVSTIEFLKIDTEGAEMLVLQGFDRMLSEHRIRAIQFEYGWINIMARVFLRDLYDYLEAREYRVGKVYPDGVDFRPYELHDEDFRGPNFVAVAGTQSDLIERLAR